jgi:hypothetical protein
MRQVLGQRHLRATVLPLAASLIWLGAIGDGARPRVAASRRPATPTRLVTVDVPTVQGLASSARLSPAQRRALSFLCQLVSAKASGNHTNQHVFGPATEVPLSAAEQPVFERQWQEAAAASLKLITPAMARAAGYVPASPFKSGVGSHWIKWSLVGRPFDPAAPGMLLFEGLPRRAVRLVGFSYWVGSETTPEGFAGPNDRWHRHSGLCFDRDGWLVDENVHTRSPCKGYWLNGRNLWMLHAWVVPDFPNRYGVFAPTNPDLCPPPTVPDIFQCQLD